MTSCQSPQPLVFIASRSFELQRAFCRFNGGGGGGRGDSGSSIVCWRKVSEVKDFITVHATALYGSGNGRLETALFQNMRNV